VCVCVCVCDAAVLWVNTETDGDGFRYEGYHRGQLEEASIPFIATATILQCHDYTQLPYQPDNFTDVYKT